MALVDFLDDSGLRVEHEGQIVDFIVKHIEESAASPEVQLELWSTCRFAFLTPARLTEIADRSADRLNCPLHLPGGL